MTKQKTYYEYLSSTGLMMVMLVFCLFNTSGHIISPVQIFPAAQVELAVEETSTINEGVLLYTPLPDSDEANFISPFLFNSEYLINYKTLVSVKYKSTSQKFISFESVSHFTQLKRIPRNSDDPFKS